ncbi:MAG: RidA family protein [Anaerolineales bacterium]|nr:MAG: RidA family protein [Anaerolineales bacterium]
MAIERINLNDPDSGFTFSTCVLAGNFIYTSHQAGMLDELGNKLDTITAQTVQCFRNLERVLVTAGATLNDIVKITVYLRDIHDFSAMRDVYRLHFAHGYPARMTATSDFVDEDCLVILDVVAYRTK